MTLSRVEFLTLAPGKIQVRFLGPEDLLEKEMATHSAGSQREEFHP